METTPDTVDSKHLSYQENFKHMLDGTPFKFPGFKHEHTPAVIDVNKAVDGKITRGDRIADAVTATIGSWRFIIIQSILLSIWIIINTIGWVFRWDPYPFILLNLALSFQAAYSAPFVMMSQNRQAVKDRLTAENDYKTDVKGEQEICHIIDHLDHQDGIVLSIVQRLEEQGKLISQQEQTILQLIHKIDEQQQVAKVQHADMLAALGIKAPVLETPVQ